MRRVLLITATVSLAAAALFGFWQVSRSRTIQLFGDLVHRVETEQRVVALTFDDGPTVEGTSSVLAILDSLDAKATFFVTGSEVMAHPEEARAILDAGHELGNHSFSHRRMVLKSPRFMREELYRTDSVIRAAGQEGEIFFRPPYSKKFIVLPWVLARDGRRSVTWDVEPESYAEDGPDSEGVIRRALEETRPGSIILLHVMYPSRGASRDALPGIINGLRARGFEFVTLGQLLDEGRSGIRAPRAEGPGSG